MSLPGVAREGATFALIGVGATLVHVTAALAARAGLGLPPLSANLVGYACAVGFSYVGNATLTFRKPSRDARQFARFVAVSALGLVLNQSIVYLLVNRLGWPFWLALGPVVVLVPALSFVLAKLWAFRR
jgi:putative flippase GtrA